MENQTRTATANEEIYRLIAEMIYLRAKPLLDEQERVLNQKIDAIADSVTALLQKLEAMYGISSAPDDVEETRMDKAESDGAVIIPAQ